MTKVKFLLVLVAVLLVPHLAHAQAGAPRWGYLEGGVIDFNPDDGESDNGGFVAGSFGLGKHIHLVAEYDDIGGYTFWNAGGGWHGGLGDKADLFAQAMWANVQVDEGDIDDNGYDIEGGIRWKIIKWFELNGQVNWSDYGGDTGSNTTGEVGVLFSFINDKMGVGANWETGDSDTTRAYFRWNFGRNK
jgi:hypothetical protein